MSYKSHRSYVWARRFMLCLGASVLCLFLALPAPIYANAIIAVHDWDTTPASGVGNWGDSGDSTVQVTENTINGSDHFLQIAFDGGIDPGPGSQWY